MELLIQNTSIGVQLLLGRRQANGVWQVMLVGTNRGGLKSTLFGPYWSDAPIALTKITGTSRVSGSALRLAQTSYPVRSGSDVWPREVRCAGGRPRRRAGGPLRPRR